MQSKKGNENRITFDKYPIAGYTTSNMNERNRQHNPAVEFLRKHKAKVGVVIGTLGIISSFVLQEPWLYFISVPFTGVSIGLASRESIRNRDIPHG